MRKPGSASNSTVWSTLILPERIQSSIEFERSIVKVRRAFKGIEEQGRRRERFLNLMYYLLGFMVGDAGKNFSPEHSWARLQLDLCRKHPENLMLGHFVSDCVLMLGIQCTRIVDSPPREREPHGLYRWQSYFSEVVVWLFTSCLGLRLDELTSYNPVRMDWLLSASHGHRVWFVRGLADSDGCVNINNRTVEITSAPNSVFVKALFNSLGVKANTYLSKGVGTVCVSMKDAMQMWIFNSELETHRTSLLRKLANARTFQRHWPEWLEMKVQLLLEEGKNPSQIRDKLLLEDNVHVKVKTLKRKQSRQRRKHLATTGDDLRLQVQGPKFESQSNQLVNRL